MFASDTSAGRNVNVSASSSHPSCTSSNPEHTSWTPIRQAAHQALASSTIKVSKSGLGKHPKGKRKRTAAKDKCILESAYIANPKPDRAARLDIVKRVSLNEKEVQIWFQNRRQNDRRKSRPLSAQEIAALRSGGMQILSPDPFNQSSTLLDERIMQVADATAIKLLASGETQFGYMSTVSDKVEEQLPHTIPSAPTSDSILKALGPPASDVKRSSLLHPTDSSLFYSTVVSPTTQWNPTNRFTSLMLNRSVHDVLKSQPAPVSPCLFVASTAQNLPPSQSSQQSLVRLSLSLEGKAEIVSAATSPDLQPINLFSDSSKLPQNISSQSLKRSNIALPSVSLPPITALTDSLPPSLGRGRSRNAHAWELCCDADAHDELTTQAENESNGSAVAAISLIRSKSGIQSMKPKRTSLASRPIQPKQGKHLKLNQMHFSLARMQRSMCDVKKSPIRLNTENIPYDEAGSRMLISSGDSEKENRSPDTNDYSHEVSEFPMVRRPLPKTSGSKHNARPMGASLHSPASTLFSGEHVRMMSAMIRRDSGKDMNIFEDCRSSSITTEAEHMENMIQGDELSPNKKGDMDCIAGLLSLSQGAWR